MAGTDSQHGDGDDDDAMWDVMDTSAADCDCPGPPPEFLLPPPPRPPILQPPDATFCSEDPLPVETCDAVPLIDASYRSSPSFQTSAVIVLCSVLLGLLVFIVVILVWKHKRKVQNFLPCKNSPQNNCDGQNAAGVTYEDLHDVIPRPTPTHHHQLTGGHIVAPSIEMIDVKNNIHFPSGYPISQHPPVFLCSSPGPDPYCSQDLYNPVYEELSDADTDMEHATHSEDEFAEDELSLGGEMERRRLDMTPSSYRPDAGLVRRDMPRFRRPHEPLPPVPGIKRHRSLERRQQEFHEGMLLDALLQLYPRVGSVEPPMRRQIPSITQRLQCMAQMPGPYETVPVLGHLATFRPVPKPYSQDSAFGSDSGYSNHTNGTRGSNRGRRDLRRLSQISADLALT